MHLRRKGTPMAANEAAPQLQVDGFYGTLVLKDWVRLRDGTQVIGFTGLVRIMDAVASTGIKPRANESAWLARVEGPTESVNWLGCQVRGVFVHAQAAGDVPRADYWLVP